MTDMRSTPANGRIAYTGLVGENEKHCSTVSTRKKMLKNCLNCIAILSGRKLYPAD
jgi:hypothetical protein